MATRKIKRFNGEFRSDVQDDAMEEANKRENLDTEAGAKATPEETPAAPSSFGAAFKAARASGGKTFEYNGKKYTTDTASASKPTAAGPGRKPAPKREAYEAPYDRMNRQNAETSAAKSSTAAETARLRQRNMPASKFNASGVNPNTLLPTKKLASGGSASSRADGIASKGKTRGTMVMCGGGMAKGKK